MKQHYLVLRITGCLMSKTVAHAFLSMYTFENAFRIQIDAQGGGELVHLIRAS